MIDLSQVPFVDGHMHPPLRVRPQTVEEYRWPWFEGLPSESAQVDGARAVPLGHPAARGRARLRGGRARRRDRHARARPADVARDRVRALADDRPGGRHRLPAARRSLPLQQIRAAGVEVAPLLRLESVAGDLIAEGLAFGDLVERYDAAVGGARDAGYAGLKSIAAYRSGLAIRRWIARPRPRRRSRASARPG